jgi:hypothetical protein
MRPSGRGPEVLDGPDPAAPDAIGVPAKLGPVMELELDKEGNERSALPTRLVSLRIHEGAPDRAVLDEDLIAIPGPLDPLG